jgi:phage shock protein E
MNVRVRKMKYVIYVFAVLALALGMFFLTYDFNSSDNSTSYKDITPKDAKEMLDSNKDVILLDVRTLAEYEEKHIPNSTLLPLSELMDKATLVIKDKDMPILVYCRSGNRSVTASLALIELGYKNVYNLGGIIDWPYETTSGK